MKKYRLLLMLIGCCTSYITAKHRFGVKVSPSISFSRLHTNPDTTRFTTNGSTLKLNIGPTYAINFAHNYYITTGLWYAIKSTSIQHEGLGIDEKHHLEYLQVPILLTLYTSELCLDTKLYFDLGGMLEVNIEQRTLSIQERPGYGKKPFIEKFKPINLAVLLGMGMEYSLSPSTAIFLGISYQRAFINSIQATLPAKQRPTVKLKNDLFCFDIGVKF